MCAGCVSKADAVAAAVGLGVYLVREPVRAALVEAGVLPDPHPLAVEMRTVRFLRDLDLDPAPILGDEVVEAVDLALAYPRPTVYRRDWRQTLAFLAGAPMRAQRVPATR